MSPDLVCISFNEDVQRYNHFCRLPASRALARIFAFDQRGFGRSALLEPPVDTALCGVRAASGQRRTTGPKRTLGGWFVRREAAKAEGGNVWLALWTVDGASNYQPVLS